jgi:hypothetical protein
MTTIYSTETPIITTKRYNFTYQHKRDAYVDACYACLVLNQAAKQAVPDMRFYLYRLKNRWVEMLYRRGYCVQAYLDCGTWHLKFKVDGIVFAWHLPERVVSWRIDEKRDPVWFNYIDDLPLRTRPLEEAVALLEWVLS